MADTAIGGARAARALSQGATRRGSKRWQLALVALVVVSAVGYLVYNGFSTNVYYQTVTELQGGTAHGQQIRLAGNVVDGSIVREAGSSTVRFNVADTGGNLPVVYSGTIPDIFGPGIEVVVEGKYNPSTGFVADTMLAKCPSKFDGETTASQSVVGGR
jgi:cytochrome c-type biogenesis protein CcmE